MMIAKNTPQEKEFDITEIVREALTSLAKDFKEAKEELDKNYVYILNLNDLDDPTVDMYANNLYINSWDINSSSDFGDELWDLIESQLPQHIYDLFYSN